MKISTILILVILAFLMLSGCGEKNQDNPIINSQIELGDFPDENLDDADIEREDHNVNPKDPSCTLDADDYDHIFKDKYGDYFYYNEKIPSLLNGWKLYLGKWKYNNVVYTTSVLYNPTTGVTSVGAEYMNTTVFFYQLKNTSSAKYHTGAFAYANYKSYTKSARSMYILWTKGGY
jgi:hypothetical protein